MDVYMYRAALLCEQHGEEIREQLTKAGKAPADPSEEHTYDSDEFPKGPYPDGGGEADTPQHCDICNEFLDNPLTGDGETYVRDAFREYVETGRGNLGVLKDWRDAYSWVFGDFTDITYPDMREDGILTDAMRERFGDLFEG